MERARITKKLKILKLYTVIFLAAIICIQGCIAQKKESSPVKQGEDKERTEQEKQAETEKEKDEDSGKMQASPSVTGALHVEGTKLTGSNGEPVQLKGISTHGLAWFPDYVNEECFRELHEEWKVNVIRLAMYTEESGGYCSDGDKEYLKGLIHKGVKYAEEQDMYVIIDWHILSDADPNIHLGEAKEFFAEMSAKYADAVHVLYEICNEPNGGTDWSEIKAYAKEVIGVIRSNDADAVILTGTPNWSQFVDEAAEDPITGYENIMYTLHFYAATHTDELRRKLSEAVEDGLPIFVSEYGICDAGGSGAVDELQAEQWIALLDRYNISYVAWNLSNKDETSAVFNSSCSKTSGFSQTDLSVSGQWLYRMLTESPEEETEVSSSKGTEESGQNEKVLEKNGVEAAVYLKNSWEADGQTVYQYELTIKNVSDRECTRWSAEIPFEGDITLTDGWNGDYTVQGNVVHVMSKEYNGTLPPGGMALDIGFIISGEGKIK